MPSKQLGATGPRVSSVGLGCMGMSSSYGPADEGESIATIRAALDAGITLLDTGDFYGMGHNESLIAKALTDRPRSEIVLSVKFGALRDPAGNGVGHAGSAAAVKSALAYSLQRLGAEYIDIYRPARLDPHVPIEETIGAIAEMVTAGYVRWIGLSEMGVETIRRAHATHPIVDLQIEYSLMSRGVESTIVPLLRSLGIGLTAYGVLARGLLSGTVPARGVRGDIRTVRMPRFAPGNVEQNLQRVAALRAIADEKHATTVQLAIAWVNAQGGDVVPLVGARRRDQLSDALGSLDLALSADDLQRIATTMPPEAIAGTRYAPAQMAELDSERT